MSLTRDQMQRANELAERIIDQQRTRIAELEGAVRHAEQLLDDGGHNNRVAAQDILADALAAPTKDELGRE